MIHLPLWASLSDPWSKTPSLLSAVVTERGRWNARLTTACRVLINTSSPPLPCFWPCSRASDYMLTSPEHFLAHHLVLGWEDGARTKAERLPVALHVIASVPTAVLSFLLSAQFSSLLPHGFWVSTSFSALTDFLDGPQRFPFLWNLQMVPQVSTTAGVRTSLKMWLDSEPQCFS